MSLRRALGAMTITLGLVATLAPGATMAAGGTIRMVDDDGHAAPGHCGASHTASSHIQTAVDAAHPGDTVLVCPGTYAEQIEILETHDLTVRSTSKWRAVIVPETSAGQSYMVGIGGVHDVTFQGFKLVAPTTGDCGKVGAAILLIGTRDTVVRGNQVRAAGSATLGACGYEVGIALGEEFLATADVGLAAPDSDPTRASVVFNSVQDFQVAGILASSPHTFATINRNSIRYYHLHHSSTDQCLDTVTSVTSAGTGVRSQLRRLVKALPDQGAGIAEDAPFACYAVGILTGFGARAIIKDNRVHSGADSIPELGPLSDATTPVLLAGIATVFPEGKATRIRDNRVYRTIADVGVLAAVGTVVEGNRLTSAVVGLFLSSVEGSLVKDNRVTDDWLGIGLLDEFYLTFPSSANRFIDNDARGNFTISCVDQTDDADSPLDGDLGTDNRWQGNTAEAGSSQPLGICGDTPI